MSNNTDDFPAECERLAKLTMIYRSDELKMKIRKREINELSEALVETFVERGIQNVKMQKGGTLYLKRKRWFNKKSGITKDQAVEACRIALLDDFVHESYDPALLKAYVLEQLEEMPPGTAVEDAVPEALRDFFQAGETTQVTLLAN